MSDKEMMIIATLRDIHYSIELIQKRFKNIKSSDFSSKRRGAREAR